MFFQSKKTSSFWPNVIVLIGLLVSAYSLWLTYQYYEEKEQLNLELKSNEIINLIKNRMSLYEQILKGGVVLFNASNNVSREEWAVFVKEYNLNKNFKGTQGFGYSEVVLPKNKQEHEERIKKEGFPDFKIRPSGQRELYTSIIYLEPFDLRNKRAFGYDMFSEKVRRNAMTKAIQSGETKLSGKIKLLQEYTQDIQPGFLMYLPVYRKNSKLETPQDRTLAIKGFVYAAFRANDLVHGILEKKYFDIHLDIYDGNFVSEKNTLIQTNIKHQDLKQFKTTIIEINGHAWTLVFKVKNIFKNEAIYIIILIPSFILILTLLLYLLLNSLIRTKENALQLAKKATKKLKVSEKRLRFALEGSGDGLWDWDIKTNKVYYSKLWKGMLGFSNDELTNTLDEWKDRLHPEDAEHINNELRAHIEGKIEVYENEYRIKCKDGSYLWVLNRGVVVSRDSNGSPLRMVGSHSDITKRKKMEKELKDKDKMIYHQSKMASMGEMIENIAHQWRQPLSVISAASTGIRIRTELEVLKEEDIGSAMVQINNSVKHLSQTLDDFRNFFKNNKKKLEFKLNDTFERTFKLITEQFKSDNITFIKNIEEVALVGFENELIQVFLNILNNARDELIKKEHAIERLILIDVVKKDTLLEICIKDNAGGIPLDIINEVFEPHFTTKEETNGTGVGLYMSQLIIKEKMNGILEASNADFAYNDTSYTGAEFKISLPLQS